jgi:hypothetical protein
MPRIRTSVWFFLVLGLLGAGAVVIPIVYNLRQQLTLEQLAEARERWESRGPTSYDLTYMERIDGQEKGDIYKVKVRRGKVVELKINKEPQKLPAERHLALTVPEMFEQIEKHLTEEEGGKRRNFVTATFDPKLGYPLRYVRRVHGSRSRLEWNVQLKPVDAPPKSHEGAGCLGGQSADVIQSVAEIKQ